MLVLKIIHIVRLPLPGNKITPPILKKLNDISALYFGETTFGTAFGTAFPKWHLNKSLKRNNLIKVWSHPRCATYHQTKAVY